MPPKKPAKPGLMQFFAKQQQEKYQNPQKNQNDDIDDSCQILFEKPPVKPANFTISTPKTPKVTTKWSETLERSAEKSAGRDWLNPFPMQVVSARKVNTSNSKSYLLANGFDGIHGNGIFYPIIEPLRSFEINLLECATTSNCCIALPATSPSTSGRICATTVFNFLKRSPRCRVLLVGSSESWTSSLHQIGLESQTTKLTTLTQFKNMKQESGRILLCTTPQCALKVVESTEPQPPPPPQNAPSSRKQFDALGNPVNNGPPKTVHFDVPTKEEKKPSEENSSNSFNSKSVHKSAAHPEKFTVKHVSSVRFPNTMKQFFDDEANFGKAELRPKNRPGRSWTEEELRLKSNSDLHKLWYVCLKERNMLITMKKAHTARARNMPNPERLDRVQESMDRIEAVVHERNDAVFRLETGESASPRKRTITSFAGFTYQKQATEQFDPPTPGQKEYEIPYLDDDAYMMQKLWTEKEFLKNRDKLDDEKRRAARTEDMDRFKRGAPRVFNR